MVVYGASVVTPPVCLYRVETQAVCRVPHMLQMEFVPLLSLGKIIHIFKIHKLTSVCDRVIYDFLLQDAQTVTTKSGSNNCTVGYSWWWHASLTHCPVTCPASLNYLVQTAFFPVHCPVPRTCFPLYCLAPLAWRPTHCSVPLILSCETCLLSHGTHPLPQVTCLL